MKETEYNVIIHTSIISKGVICRKEELEGMSLKVFKELCNRRIKEKEETLINLKNAKDYLDHYG